MVCNSVKAPCPECPFSRSVTPGALGGSSPFKYIGQIIGPFVLPCHMHCDFNDPQWREKSADTPQCRGAAEMRANIGVQDLLPVQFQRVPTNHEGVFSTLPEFLAHHGKMPLEQARAMLSSPGVLASLLKAEMGNQRVIRFGEATHG